MNTKEWLVVVNPAAGGRKAEQDWPEIEDLLQKHEIQYKAIFSERRLHAMLIAREMVVKGYKHIIVVGGDGTMNEVINGIFAQDKVSTTEIMLGMITVGTGNDWGRMFDIPSDYSGAIKTIKDQKTFIQDAGLVSYQRQNKTWKRYFINIAGMGFGARVVERSNNMKDKGKTGKALYFMTIFTSLFSYKSKKASIEIDGNAMDRKVFSMNVGIGKYNGGGMIQVPDAIADDGLYSITLIKKMSRLNVIASLKKLYDGKINEHRKVETYTAKKISVDSRRILQLETDGETLGHAPMEFEIIPKSVKVITNQSA